MLYDDVSKLRKQDTHPRHEYKGELIQYVLVKSSETMFLESKQRYIVTSIEKGPELNIIHIYYNGKRITGKRIMTDKPILNESSSLIDWLVMKIKAEEIN